MSTSLDVSYLLGVADDPEIYTRVRLVMQLCEFLDEGETTVADRDAVVQVLLRLSEDVSSVVRRTLLSKTIASTSVPEDIALALAADEEDIACEVLQEYDGYADSTLVGVARISDLPRQLAIAKRRKLPSCIAQVLIERGDPKVCRVVLASPHSQLNRAAYDAVERHHGPLSNFEKILAKRRDLPPVYAIRMVDEVSSRLYEHAARKQWMKPGAAKQVVADACEQGIVRIIAKTDFGDDVSVVSELMKREKLTPSLLLRAACIGKMDFVEQSICELSGMPGSMVHSMMFARGAVGFKALYAKTGLPTKLYPAMRVAVDVYGGLLKTSGDWNADQFGRRMIERILTQYEQFSEADKKYLLNMLKRYATADAGHLVDQVLEDLAIAA